MVMSTNVIFVAPYFLDATTQFIDATTRVPDCRVGLVSCDSEDKLPAELRSRLSAHFRVQDITTAELRRGVEAIGKHFGSVDRLLGMLEQIQVPLGEIRDQLGIAGVGGQTANHFRDKSVMKTVLRQNGIPCAAHQLIDNHEAATEFAQRIGFPLIVKPPDGAGAKGTYRCENQGQLNECLETLRPQPDNPVLLEQFVTGEEFSFDSVAIGGRLVWHSISRYQPRPLEVVEEPWIQWCVIIPKETDGPEYSAIKQVAEPAIRALGLETGLSHMEWFRLPNGQVAVSEVGARPPGAQIMSLMSYAHNLDMYQAWAELMIHDRFACPPREYACGAAYLRGMGQGKKIVAVHGLDNVAKQFQDVVVEARLPKYGQSPSSSYEGDGFIIVRHADTDVVQNVLKEIITHVRVETGD